jgi:hypothetical protein
MPAATAAAEPLLEPPGRALRVPRVARAARLARGKFGGDGLAEDDGAGLAQRRNGGAVAVGAPAGVERRAHLGRHVDRFDNVLDAERHAIDGRERRPGTPALGRRIGSRAGAGDVDVDERADLRLPDREGLQTTFQDLARAVGARVKLRTRRQERAQDGTRFNVGGQHGHAASPLLSS